MGKRSEGFERASRDLYPTIDPDAVSPLLPHLGEYGNFVEPCAGAGNLSDLIYEQSNTSWCAAKEFDIQPMHPRVLQKNALFLTNKDVEGCRYIITNPPFSWAMLKPLLDHLPKIKTTWLLLPADIMHNKRMAPYMGVCAKVVSVGRLYWQENKVKGVDNYCWYRFDSAPVTTIFHGRQL